MKDRSQDFNAKTNAVNLIDATIASAYLKGSHPDDSPYTPMSEIASRFCSLTDPAMWHGSAMWGTRSAQGTGSKNNLSAREL
jgi:hypothetical protein